MNIAFVPVRGGSKSIPRKNIKLFCGEPLVFWCLNELNKVTSIDKIIVASDCDEIISVVENFNFKKVDTFKRSKENATDTASTESVILEYLNKKEYDKNDLFMLVQATSPFTTVDDFEKAIKVIKSTKYDSIVSCVRSKKFIWNEQGFPENYCINKRPRRQDITGHLVENGAFYLSNVGNITKNANRVSGEVYLYEMDEINAFEIDEKIDWFIAEQLMLERIRLSMKYNFSELKLFISDVDGTLTDAGMYYSEDGNEIKKFNTHDGHGFALLRELGIKTGIITSEETIIVKNRAKKLQVDYLYQGKSGKSKLEAVKEICKTLRIKPCNVAFIGDDVNDFEVLSEVGFPACPSNANKKILSIPSIYISDKKGGEGCVRQFIDEISRISSC